MQIMPQIDTELFTLLLAVAIDSVVLILCLLFYCCFVHVPKAASASAVAGSVDASSPDADGDSEVCIPYVAMNEVGGIMAPALRMYRYPAWWEWLRRLLMVTDFHVRFSRRHCHMIIF